MQYRVGLGVLGLVVLGAWGVEAASLGIPFDSFLTQLETFVIGMGMIVGMVGLIGYIGSLMDNPFSHILGGSISFFTKAGLLGGGTIIMGLVGLVSGATLPL